MSNAIQMVMIALVGALLAWSANTIYNTSLTLAALTQRMTHLEGTVREQGLKIDWLKDNQNNHKNK